MTCRLLTTVAASLDIPGSLLKSKGTFHVFLESLASNRESNQRGDQISRGQLRSQYRYRNSGDKNCGVGAPECRRTVQRREGITLPVLCLQQCIAGSFRS